MEAKFRAPVPENDDARLAALRRYNILDSAREQAYDDITSLAAFICDAPFSTITLVDQDRQWFKSEQGFGVSETNRDDSMCACAILQTSPMIVEDTLLDERFRDNPFVTGWPGIRFYAGAPLVTGDGFVLGTVCIFDTKPRTLTSPQINSLEALARQTMAHLDLRLRMAEAEKQAQVLRTAEKLAAVGRLASSMAHEINNPLQSVTNLLFVAAMTEGAESKQFVAQAQDELGRVSHIVTQTLRFHNQSIAPESARIGEIVESVIALFATRLRHASANVFVEDRQTDALAAYASDLRQVFANFIGNALDAIATTEPRAIRVRIRDEQNLRTGEPGVRVLVTDSGIGIPAENHAKLAEPFFSTKGARGTGLGLWVSRGILTKHKATLAIRSCTEGPRRGTTFSIFFPHANGITV